MEVKSIREYKWEMKSWDALIKMWDEDNKLMNETAYNLFQQHSSKDFKTQQELLRNEDSMVWT